MTVTKFPSTKKSMMRLVTQKQRERVVVTYLPDEEGTLRFGDKHGALRHISLRSKIAFWRMPHQTDPVVLDILAFGTLLDLHQADTDLLTEQCVPLSTFLQWAMLHDHKRLESNPDQYRLRTLAEWHAQATQIFNNLETVLVPWEVWQQAL